MTAKLASYLSRPAVTINFQITIQKCIVTSFTMLAFSPSQDKSYTIASSTTSWSIPFSSIQTTQVPACGYTQTFTSTATSSKITQSVSANTISYSIHSDDVLDAGVKTVTVLSTLNNSPTEETCELTF